MHRIRFGLSLPPSVADVEQVRELALLADAAGLDLLGIQDHPYVSQFLDTMSLIAVRWDIRAAFCLFQQETG